MYRSYSTGSILGTRSHQIFKYSVVEWMTKGSHLLSLSSLSLLLLSQLMASLLVKLQKPTSCILLTRCKTSAGLHTCSTNWLQNSSECLFSPLYYSPDPDFTNSATFYSHLTIIIPSTRNTFLIYRTKPESPSWSKLRVHFHSSIGTPRCQAHRWLSAYPAYLT